MSAQPSVVPRLPLSERMAVASLVASIVHDEAWQKANLPEVLDALGIPHDERPRIDADPLAAAKELHDPQLRRMVIWDLLALALSDGRYDAREREGIRRLAAALEVPWNEVAEAEARLSPGTRREDGRADRASWSRAAAWTAASVALAIAAPALGTFFVSLKAAAAVKAGLVMVGGGSKLALRTAVAGAAATIAPAFRTRRDLEGLDEHHLVRLGAPGMHVVVGVPGFLADATELKDAWLPLSRTRGEPTLLRYDSSRLWTLGAALQRARRDPRVCDAFARFRGAGEAASLSLDWPAPAIVAAREHLAEPARLAFERAQTAGRLLGKLLAERAHGFRPVTLVGTSFGAAVVLHALEHLAVENVTGVVHNVALLGGVMPLVPGHVSLIDPVVAGRIVNVYSSKDHLLALLAKATGDAPPAGLAPVDGVENVDATDLTPDGQLDYPRTLDAVLTRAELP